MKAFPLFHIILLLGFVLILKVPLSASGLIFENNPFYGLHNDGIRSVESITDDSLIRVKLEYAPSAIQIGSSEFFRATLFHNEKNEIVPHADTDIAMSKNGKELYKASISRGIHFERHLTQLGHKVISKELFNKNFSHMNI